MGSLAVDSTIVKNWREFPPFSYSLKINKLSQLNLVKYESRYFSSGGYNWRLTIFPNGNEEENGSGYISMYVEIDTKSLMSKPQSEVFAYLTFFVYCKKENKYFTIHDVEVKRFNAIRTMWGLSQVLLSDVFKDPKKGYIFEGEQCEFGVDVMVISPFTNWEIVSFNDKLTHPKFSWSLKKFSELKENMYISDEFSMGGKKWNLRLDPNGYQTAEVNKWPSFYLILSNKETLTADEKIYVRANLRLIDPEGSNHATKKIESWFSYPGNGWGQSRFLSLSEVKKCYLDKEDSLILEIEFEVVSATNYSAII